MATYTVTKEQSRQNFSYALGKLLGQKAKGSGDPTNEFSIVTTPNYDKDGVFLKTYTVEIPDGRATDVQVQAILDDPNPEQPEPAISERDARIAELRERYKNDIETPEELRELDKLERGLEPE